MKKINQRYTVWEPVRDENNTNAFQLNPVGFYNRVNRFKTVQEATNALLIEDKVGTEYLILPTVFISPIDDKKEDLKKKESESKSPTSGNIAVTATDHLIHGNGDAVREQWFVGREVFFKPKGFLRGPALKGVVTGHIYVNVLIIKSGETEWMVSTNRCEPV